MLIAHAHTCIRIVLYVQFGISLGGHMIPCIVLASSPLFAATDPKWVSFKKEYADFVKGTLRTIPYDIELKDPDENDGGNGGGGEAGASAVKPRISKLGKCFWDFKAYPGKVTAPGSPPVPDGDKFPEPLRFELCVPFSDISYALAWLQQHPAGLRLQGLFKYVQVVALSTPLFVGSDRTGGTDSFVRDQSYIG